MGKVCDCIKDSDLFSASHKGPLRTTYARAQTFKRMFKYVEPKAVRLGYDENMRQRIAYYIPVKQTLISLLESELWKNSECLVLWSCSVLDVFHQKKGNGSHVPFWTDELNNSSTKVRILSPSHACSNLVHSNSLVSLVSRVSGFKKVFVSWEYSKTKTPLHETLPLTNSEIWPPY